MPAIPTPTLPGFINFIRTVMGISTTILPDTAPVIPVAYEFALEIVNASINAASALMYTAAVYNLAGDNLINYAPDVPNAPNVAGSQLPFFADQRKRLDISGFISGVVQSASDEGTSSSFVVQEAARNFTLADLQNLKTVWGRQYLAIAQKYGPSIWGIS